MPSAESVAEFHYHVELRVIYQSLLAAKLQYSCHVPIQLFSNQCQSLPIECHPALGQYIKGLALVQHLSLAFYFNYKQFKSLFVQL